jgi:hypothetical protein
MKTVRQQALIDNGFELIMKVKISDTLGRTLSVHYAKLGIAGNQPPSE